MNEYHKIQSIYKRDNKGKFIVGQWSCPEFEFLAKNEWVFTEKVDGTNIRIMWDGQNLTFGGKTDNAQIPAFLVTRLNNLFMTIEQRQKFAENFKDGVCFYGEGYGAKIQGCGGNYKSTQDFVLFDVKVGTWWLERESVEDIAKTFGIEVVPIIGSGTIADAENMCKEGFESRWGKFIAEGIVLRPKVELKTRRGDRIITKIKYKDFNPCNQTLRGDYENMGSKRHDRR